MHTKSTLLTDLKNMGFQGTETILVHASMRSIGPVDGGADTVLDTLCEFFQDGLLVFPAHTWDQISAKNPEYDVRNSPTCVGILTERFRKRPGVFRTLHPTHSLSAYGKDARSFTEGQEIFNTPCSPFSCYGQLPRRDAFVLLLGVDFSRNTSVHCVEELAQVPGRMTQDFEKLYATDEHGNRHLVLSRRHDNAESDYYVKLQDPMTKAGLIRRVSFGDASCMLIRERDLFEYTFALLSKSPLLFSDDRPIPDELTQNLNWKGILKW